LTLCKNTDILLLAKKSFISKNFSFLVDKNITVSDKAKLSVRWGRKASGLVREMAELPKENEPLVKFGLFVKGTINTEEPLFSQ
jgi:hypothetical protein